MDVQKFIDNKEPRILVLSGAGLSAESGISTFRDAEDALWEGVNINDVCNIANLDRNYHKIHAFYNTLRGIVGQKEPNDAHYFLSILESNYGDESFLHITSNVDDLYERAGGTCMKLHGNIKEVIEGYSMANNDFTVVDMGYEPYFPRPEVYAKPNVVFIGEYERYVDSTRIPLYDERNKVLQSLRDHDTVIVIGSSNIILRWSDMVGMAPGYAVNVNIHKNENDWMFQKRIYNPVTKAIPDLEKIIEERMNK